MTNYLRIRSVGRVFLLSQQWYRADKSSGTPNETFGTAAGFILKVVQNAVVNVKLKFCLYCFL